MTIKSSSKGLPHFIAQRITAIALIPLSIWFVLFVIKLLRAENVLELHTIFTSPFHIALAMLFLIAFLYHGYLGMRVVFDDYIKCPKIKAFLNISLLFLTSTSIVVGIFSFAYFYIIGKIFFPC